MEYHHHPPLKTRQFANQTGHLRQLALSNRTNVQVEAPYIGQCETLNNPPNCLFCVDLFDAGVDYVNHEIFLCENDKNHHLDCNKQAIETRLEQKVVQ